MLVMFGCVERSLQQWLTAFLERTTGRRPTIFGPQKSWKSEGFALGGVLNPMCLSADGTRPGGPASQGCVL